MASRPVAPDLPVAAARPPVRRRFGRRRVVALLALLGLLVASAIAAFGLWRWLSPAPTVTVWQAITAGISDGPVPKDIALEAFAYLYKVNIPGVTVPNGVEGGDGPTSGTGAMRWVRANWDQLTADQQAVINPFLTPGANDYAIPIDASPSAAMSGNGRAPRVRLAAIKVAGPSDAPSGLAVSMAAEVEADIARIGPKLGMPVLPGGSWPFPNIELILSEADAGNLLFTTIAENGKTGAYEPCRITAWKNTWQGEAGGGGVSPLLHVLITHEVVHCYQNVVFGNAATAAIVPSWIVEGSAMYLAADDTHVAEPMLPSVWSRYFMPDIALTARTYDAFGYFSFLAQQHGRDLWGLMRQAWAAAAAPSGSSNSFIAVLTGDNSDIRDNWAESYVRESAWGDPWVVDGFGLSPGMAAARHPAQALQDPGWTGSLQGRSNIVLNVDATYGEVVTVATSGEAGVHDGADHSALAFQDQRFCTVSDGCVCPKGTLLEGQDMAPDQLAIPFVAAFNAPLGGSTYSVVGEKLEDLCQRKPTPKPTTTPAPTARSGGSKGRCGPGCTTSNGDPHMVTVSGANYDFQALGEFTLLRSVDGTLEIQARQEPYGTGGSVSMNTAIAAKVGGHRVGVYMTGANLGVHLDGTAIDLAAGPTDLGSGARIAAVDGGFEIDFPDGPQLWALSVGGFGINVQVKPSASLAAGGAGLLGPVASSGMRLPALPDGTTLPAGADHHAYWAALYGQFADAWRVTDATTLFDYDPGQSTATFAVTGYPAEGKDLVLADIPGAQLAAGEAACTAITDPALHDQCVFDVAVSGATGFATSYQATQAFLDPTTPPAVGAGAMTVTSGIALGGYAQGPDNIVYLSVQTANNAYSLISFDPVAGRIVRQVDVPNITTVHYAAGSVWLPGLVADAVGSICSVTRFDAATLAEQATIPIPCPFSMAPAVASDGQAIWFVDVSKYDSATGTGAAIIRMDPTTNTPGTSVPVPFINGFLFDSLGAVFYSDPQKGWERVVTGSTTADSLGVLTTLPRPAGTGLWVEGADHATAAYVTQAGGAGQVVQINGSLVGGDAQAAYTDVRSNAAGGATEEQLWRYPIDGSAATKIAVAPTVDGSSLDYTGDPLAASDGKGVLKLWLTHALLPQQPAPVLLQWTPLP